MACLPAGATLTCVLQHSSCTACSRVPVATMRTVITARQTSPAAHTSSTYMQHMHVSSISLLQHCSPSCSIDGLNFDKVLYSRCFQVHRTLDGWVKASLQTIQLGFLQPENPCLILFLQKIFQLGIPWRCNICPGTRVQCSF